VKRILAFEVVVVVTSFGLSFCSWSLSESTSWTAYSSAMQVVVLVQSFECEATNRKITKIFMILTSDERIVSCFIWIWIDSFSWQRKRQF
jgi:hypothetical protein